MITVQLYLYPVIMVAHIWDPTIYSVTRNQPVYAKPIKIYQGVDNPVQVRIRNQEQRPVNMTGRSLQVDIQDPGSYSTIFTFGVNFYNRDKGFGSFVIDKDTVNTLDKRQYKITFKVVDETALYEQPAYIDDNYGVPLDLIVLPAYYGDMPPQEGETDDYLIIDSGNEQ